MRSIFYYRKAGVDNSQAAEIQHQAQSDRRLELTVAQTSLYNFIAVV
jgi:hypothetical protein